MCWNLYGDMVLKYFWRFVRRRRRRPSSSVVVRRVRRRRHPSSVVVVRRPSSVVRRRHPSSVVVVVVRRTWFSELSETYGPNIFVTYTYIHKLISTYVYMLL